MPKMSGCNDLACLQRKPLADILAAQAEFVQGAPSAVEGVPFVTRMLYTLLTWSAMGNS